MDIFAGFTSFDWSVFQLVEKLWNPVLDAIMVLANLLFDDLADLSGFITHCFITSFTACRRLRRLPSSTLPSTWTILESSKHRTT